MVFIKNYKHSPLEYCTIDPTIFLEFTSELKESINVYNNITKGRLDLI